MSKSDAEKKDYVRVKKSHKKLNITAKMIKAIVRGLKMMLLKDFKYFNCRFPLKRLLIFVSLFNIDLFIWYDPKKRGFAREWKNRFGSSTEKVFNLPLLITSS
jgi:hypothetical protein